MNDLLEFIPLIGFLLSYFLLKDIYTATAILMILYAVLYIFLKISQRKINRTFQFTFWLVFFFGGLTIVFQNELFIQWKPTLFSWGCAGFLVLFKFRDKKAFALKSIRRRDKRIYQGRSVRQPTNRIGLPSFSIAPIVPHHSENLTPNSPILLTKLYSTKPS